jgi:O-antigen biosynthesis protein
MQKICLISPEIVGPHRNGGIGTHVFYLAKLLAEAPDCHITILYTGAIGSKTIEYWRQHFKSKFGARFIHESELPPFFLGHTCNPRDYLLRSQKVYGWLKTQNFNVCHFQDYIADGFISIQAKRMGQAFHNTTLTCMAHSSHTWIYQATQAFPASTMHQLILDYAERYCMKHADIILSPSQYMLDWMTENQWEISQTRKVIPYMMNLNWKLPPVKFAKRRIIFFGRLETRKGVELFLDALKQAAPQLEQYASKGHPIKIDFLGKVAITTYPDTRQAIETFFTDFTDLYKCEILDSKSQPEALEHLVNHASALVVTPSLIDNFPCAILECVELGLNVISSNVGGIPEILGEERLFSPNATALAQKLKSCFDEGLSPLDVKYSVTKAQALWKSLHQSIAETPTSPQPRLDEQTPLVSVCIPYYNCGDYLPDLLFSLERQTYKNFEVVVVNDGSTQMKSCQIFEAMQVQYADYGWTFLSKSNGGLGNARNFGARHAKGQYLVFVDADNAAEPDMLERMVKGITNSDADCLTSYFRAFDNDHGPFSQLYTYAYTPAGNCTEAGIYENVFGDANIVIKRSIYEALGGFKESQTHTWEDWEFLGRLSLLQYDLDVIPEFLFLYRHRSDSLTRTTSRYGNHLFAITPYLKEQPLWLQRLFVSSVGISQYVPGQAEQRVSHLQLKLTEVRQRTKLIKTRLEQVETELNQAKARIIAMETSKFWQIRKAWFKLKKLLNLPTNE